MARMARGTITYEYEITSDIMQGEFEQEYPNGTEKDLIRFFTERMVDDIINNAYSDLAPCIEMEIV